MEKVYAKGFWFNKKRDNAPEFVLGSITLSKKTFLEWLDGQSEDEKGYVKLSVLMGKENKPYAVLDTWKPQPKEEVNINSFM